MASPGCVRHWATRATPVDQGLAERAHSARRFAEVQTAHENTEQRLTAAVAALEQARENPPGGRCRGGGRTGTTRVSSSSERLADASATVDDTGNSSTSGTRGTGRPSSRPRRSTQTLSEDFARRQTALQTALEQEIALRLTLEAKG